MFIAFKKTFLACILTLITLTTGAWQSNEIVLASRLNTNIPETPLYPGLTWSSIGSSSRDITINVNGDTTSLSGKAYKAAEQFASGIIPQDVLNYYSNEQLAKSGWTSYDASEKPDRVHYIFYHESGLYLSIEFLKCPVDTSSVCVTVWKSEQTTATSLSEKAFGSSSLATATGSFGKTSPADGATNIDPANVTLSWGTYSPTPDKYSYCVKEGSTCDASDPNWTGTYTNTSVTLTDLSYGKTYYWQVKAITCSSCVPKTYVYADGGTWWTFQTKAGSPVVILGNAGVAGAVLSYTDSTLKTVTADSTGAYAITVPWNWSGTVTPSKSGYLFSPKSASFSNLTAVQTIQNFNAMVAYTISGNVGIPGAILSYTDGTPQTVTADSSGNYSITVPMNWSGTITPSKTGYTFSPASRNYVNVVSNQTIQNYIVLLTISGNAGIAGATLSYTDGTAKTVIADGSGNYSITVLYGWSGIVTPSKTGLSFSPVNRTYTKLVSNQTAQDYIALVTISGNVGAAGVAMNYMDGIVAKMVMSLTDGSYSLKVPIGWGGIVTPSHACYTFSPVNISYSGLATSQLLQNYTATINAASGCADVDILIGGALKGEFGIASNELVPSQYPGMLTGPVRVVSTNGASILVSQVVSSGGSYNELMGYPVSAFTTEYWFPYYDHGYPTVSGSNMRMWVLVGNPSTSLTATVNIYIGGVLQADPNNPGVTNFSVGPGANITPRWVGLQGGPVRVVSDIPVFASERVLTSNNNAFNESLGYPANQFTNEYWFPWYDNVNMNTKVVVGNTSGSQAANVDIYIGTSKKGSYVIPINGSLTKPYVGVVGGPVRVVSTNAVNIVTSLNSTSGAGMSYSDVLGYPFDQFANEYWFPYYDHGYPNVSGSNMRMWVLVGNPSTSLTATVNIFVGGVLQAGSPFSIVPGGNITPRWIGLQGGPVRVVSDIPVFASERVFTAPNSVFNEMMGYAVSKLGAEYWFPWYDSINMTNNILIGKP